MQYSRYSGCAVSAGGGQIVITGGQMEGEVDLNTVEVYDTGAGGAWRPISAMARARRHHGCAVAYSHKFRTQAITDLGCRS